MNSRQNDPRIARIWRGRTLRSVADEYEAYNYDVGIRPLIEKALGVQILELRTSSGTLGRGSD